MAQYLLNTTDAEMAEWRRDAEANSMSLAEWLRQAGRVYLRRKSRAIVHAPPPADPDLVSFGDKRRRR